MKMNEENYEEDLMMNESDEFLLEMTEQLKQELKDVKVSEQLIAKTLKAVEKDEQITDVKKVKITKASIMKYAMRFVGVAAAFFVLVVGYQFISQFGFSSKDSATNSEEKQEVYAPSVDQSAEAPQSAAPMATQAIDYAEDSVSLETTADTAENNKVTVSTVENLAFTFAVEEAKRETTDETIIHTYQGDTTQDQCTQLLLLFQSEALSLSSDDVTEDWRSLIILSTDNESAILYKVGKKEYVVAQVYDTTGLTSETVYHVSDMAQLHQSIDEIINQ